MKRLFRLIKPKRKYHPGGIIPGGEQVPLERLEGEVITMIESGKQYMVIDGEFVPLVYRPKFLRGDERS